MNSFFDILKEDYEELYKLGLEIESSIYTAPSDAVIKSRLFAEKLLIKVADLEDEQYIKYLNQYERINLLAEDGILNEEIVKELHVIRVTGNKAAHEGENNDIEYSVKLHKKLYSIVKWFFETYDKNYNMKFPPYKPVPLPEVKEAINLSEIDSLIQKRLENYIEVANKKVLVEEKGIERNLTQSQEELEIEKAAMAVLGFEYMDEILPEKTDEKEVQLSLPVDKESQGEEKIEYKFVKYKGSYLLNELRKLSDSSKEAVESYVELEPFKEYLHVKRSIQQELIDTIAVAHKNSRAQLVLLCGNVGDGKSHMLAYLNDHHKELMRDFHIHNDATESFDPSRTELETLEEVLAPFEDGNIEGSNEKLILAINLGVLNNFLEETSKKGTFNELRRFIDNSGIFEQEKINSNTSSDYFRLVSFGDYNIYELTEKGPESSYITGLLNKIVAENEDNPFYKAYTMDMETYGNNPIIINYRLLSAPGVIDSIVRFVIFAMVNSKKLISTRELMNFIYEIIVPVNYEDFDMSSTSFDYIDALLPNLLFNSKERGIVLKILTEVDPLQVRAEEIDQLIIRLNIANSIKEVIKEYLPEELCYIADVIVGNNSSISNMPEGLKEKFLDTVIRLLAIAGTIEYKKLFQDEDFIFYMKYLFYYNNGQPKNYKGLFEEVKRAVFHWNGSPKDDYIYLNNTLETFAIAERLDIKYSAKKGRLPEKDSSIIERFKGNIKIAFEVGNEPDAKEIIVDYQLFKKLVAVNKGYYASKNDKEEAVIFVEFIDSLIKHGNMNNELYVKALNENKSFRLLYEDDFGEEFTFERVDRL